MFLTDQNGPNEGAPILVRWTLHRPSGRLTETVLDDRGNEFPWINGRHGGQAYRYIYTAHWGEDVAFGPAMKHDVQRETTEVHDYGPGRMTSEPVLVRKPGAAAEDEGWIMSYVYDPNATSATSSSWMPRTSPGRRSRRSVCPFAYRSASTVAGLPM
jgi:carotenoid cleavage dioxygenase-like enzyme